MKNPSAGFLPWRRTVILTVALPLMISLAVMAYAWPASRIAPRDLPVGVVGTSTASQHAIEGLSRNKPGGFDFHLYPDQASARAAIKSREVYGAFAVTAGNVTVLEASAASTSVAQMLTTVGQQLADHAAKSPTGDAAPSSTTSHRTTAQKRVATAPRVGVRTVDVVPSSADDPRGVVFNSALLPLTICSILIAVLIAMSGIQMPAWRRVVDLFAACAATGLAAYLVAQGLLGALPHDPVSTWAALSLTMLAISATGVGLITLIGSRGLGVSAALMVFIGNPFSGITSAPELLPKAVSDVGQWLPPGAGASLLRGTAYFDGNGSAGSIAVLVLWCVLGLTAVTFGRRTPTATVELISGDGPGADGTSTSPVVTETPALSPTPANHSHSHGRHTAHE